VSTCIDTFCAESSSNAVSHSWDEAAEILYYVIFGCGSHSLARRMAIDVAAERTLDVRYVGDHFPKGSMPSAGRNPYLSSGISLADFRRLSVTF
jgi:hypothetical protein